MSGYRLTQGHDGRLRARGTDAHDDVRADDQPGATHPWPFGAVVAFRRRKGPPGF